MNSRKLELNTNHQCLGSLNDFNIAILNISWLFYKTKN